MKHVSTTSQQKISQVWRLKKDTIIQERHSFQSTSTTSATTTNAISIHKLIISMPIEDKASSSLQSSRELIKLVDVPQVPHSLFLGMNSSVAHAGCNGNKSQSLYISMVGGSRRFQVHQSSLGNGTFYYTCHLTDGARNNLCLKHTSLKYPRFSRTSFLHYISF